MRKLLIFDVFSRLNFEAPPVSLLSFSFAVLTTFYALLEANTQIEKFNDLWENDRLNSIRPKWSERALGFTYFSTATRTCSILVCMISSLDPKVQLECSLSTKQLLSNIT